MPESKAICTLTLSRPCPKRIGENICSDKDSKCCFKQEEVVEETIPTSKEYVRKPRWYDRYYNR